MKNKERQGSIPVFILCLSLMHIFYIIKVRISSKLIVFECYDASIKILKSSKSLYLQKKH